MPADDLTAWSFTSSLVLNPPSSRLSVPPDVLRALRTYRIAVLRALGPSTSPISSPLRLRGPSTVTRFYAALLDHPTPPPGARTPPAVSSAYDALWAAAREAVTPDVWDEMCRRRAQETIVNELVGDALKVLGEEESGSRGHSERSVRR
ncbi:hypothetical protein JCM9279_003028 [Rhodotorula babjevae]